MSPDLSWWNQVAISVVVKSSKCMPECQKQLFHGLPICSISLGCSSLLQLCYLIQVDKSSVFLHQSLASCSCKGLGIPVRKTKHVFSRASCCLHMQIVLVLWYQPLDFSCHKLPLYCTAMLVAATILADPFMMTMRTCWCGRYKVNHAVVDLLVLQVSGCKHKPSWTMCHLNPMVLHGKSKLIKVILRGAWMSAPDFMAVHPIIFDIWVWTKVMNYNWHCHPTAMLLMCL